jgi:hypothetical protein
MKEKDLARNALLLRMKLEGVLTDEMISHEEGQIILFQPFVKWPPELRKKLEPYGASRSIR